MTRRPHASSRSPCDCSAGLVAPADRQPRGQRVPRAGPGGRRCSPATFDGSSTSGRRRRACTLACSAAGELPVALGGDLTPAGHDAAGARRDQPADDDVLLEPGQAVDLAGDVAASVSTRVVSWNEAAEMKRAGLQARLGDALQHRHRRAPAGRPRRSPWRSPRRTRCGRSARRPGRWCRRDRRSRPSAASGGRSPRCACR